MWNLKSQKRNKRQGLRDGQMIVEFTFTMIIVLLMMFSVVMVFRWTGMDLAERRIAHDERLTTDVEENYGSCTQWADGDCIEWDSDHPDVCVRWEQICANWVELDTGPLNQLDTYFYRPIKMNATWGED